MLNKTCILVTAICMTVISLPSYAWRAAGYGGRGAARGSYGGAAAWNRNTAVVRGPHGNTAAWHRGGGAYHAPVHAYGYRGGTYYRGGAYYGGNYGYSSGQVAAAGVAGLAVGAMAGAAVANSNQPSNTTVIIQQPASSWAIGTNFNSLPGGCSSVMVNYVQYFRCGPSWVRPYSGYYQVVPMPY